MVVSSILIIIYLELLDTHLNLVHNPVLCIIVILSTWVGSDSPLPWLLSEVTQVVVWRAMLALSGNATGFRPTVVVWLKTFQRIWIARSETSMWMIDTIIAPYGKKIIIIHGHGHN